MGDDECPGGAGGTGSAGENAVGDRDRYDAGNDAGFDAARGRHSASADSPEPAESPESLEEGVARELAAVFDAALADEPPSRVTAESVLAAARSRRGGHAARRWARSFSLGGPGLRWAGGLTAVAALVAAVVVMAPNMRTVSSSDSSAAAAGGALAGGDAAGAAAAQAAAPSMATAPRAYSDADTASGGTGSGDSGPGSAGSDSAGAESGSAVDGSASSAASAARPETTGSADAEASPAANPAAGVAATGPAAATTGANPPAATPTTGAAGTNPQQAGPSSAPGAVSTDAAASSTVSSRSTAVQRPLAGAGGATAVSPDPGADCAAQQLPPLTEREMAAIGARVPRATVEREIAAATCLPRPLRGSVVVLTEPDGTTLALTVAVFDWSGGAPALPSSTVAATSVGPASVVVVTPDPTRSRPPTAVQRQDMQVIAGAVAAAG